MAKVKPVNQPAPKKPRRPAIDPENRENQLIALTYDLVEQRLRDGTASSQETTYFLKASSAKYRYETEKLNLEKELVKAKTESLKSVKRSEELMEEALKAFRSYAGQDEYNDD